MSSVDKYKILKRDARDAKEWAGMLGKSYRGGGGGIGSVVTACIKAATIYYQEYNGATNYHDVPTALIPYLEQAIKNQFSALLAKAIQTLDEDLSVAASDAAMELKQAMEDAGLSTKDILATTEAA